MERLPAVFFAHGSPMSALGGDSHAAALGRFGERYKPSRAILVISSYLPELMGICDRIHVMCRGNLGPAHPVSETNDHKLLLEATGTDAA